MSIRVPFFGLISSRSPMRSLLDHYDKIAAGMSLIEESLECYISGGGFCKDFKNLTEEVDKLEEQADKIKRSIRNHLPRGLFMPVDKRVFFNYTRSQDNILDYGQEALNWLLIRPTRISEDFQKGLVEQVGEVNETVRLLRPALESTVGLVGGKHYDRSATKNTIRAVRKQHKKVTRVSENIRKAIYNADMDFKDTHQFIEYTAAMHAMSHNTEACADLLRAMIAR